MGSQVPQTSPLYSCVDRTAEEAPAVAPGLPLRLTVLGHEHGCDQALVIATETQDRCPSTRQASETADGRPIAPNKGGILPISPIGAFEPPPPQDPEIVPHFPIILVQDVPLLVVLGYHRDGAPNSAIPLLNYFREHGKLRSAPLVPTARPLDILAELERTPAWKYLERTGTDRHLIIAQLLRLVDNVHPRGDRELMKEAHRLRSRVAWDRFVQKWTTFPMRWDAQQCRYVRSPQNEVK
jgi:hypothetical protein